MLQQFSNHGLFAFLSRERSLRIDLRALLSIFLKILFAWMREHISRPNGAARFNHAKSLVKPLNRSLPFRSVFSDRRNKKTHVPCFPAIDREMNPKLYIPLILTKEKYLRCFLSFFQYAHRNDQRNCMFFWKGEKKEKKQ